MEIGLRGVCWTYMSSLITVAACSDTNLLTVLHTSDVAGHVVSLRYREHAAYHGGLLRCATLIERVRSEVDYVLVVDAGNLLEGSPESIVSRGALPAQAIRYMGYQARVAAPGIGTSSIRSAAAFLDGYVPRVSATIWPDRGEVEEPFSVPLWRVLSIGPLRVGVVGWDGPGIPGACTFPNEAQHRFAEGVRSLRGERPDVSVLLFYTRRWHSVSELKAGIRDMVYRYPDFDLILGGGSRASVPGFRAGNTWYGQADDGGRSVGRFDLLVNHTTGLVDVTRAELMPAGRAVPEQAALRRRLGAKLGRIERQLTDVIGYSELRIDGGSRHPGQSSLQELMSRSLVEGLGVDIVLMGKEKGGYLAKGAIQYGDILRAVPSIERWASLALTPRELRAVLAENLTDWSTSKFLGIHGATYTARLESQKMFVEELRLVEGGPPHGRRRLHVLFKADIVDAPGRHEAFSSFRDRGECRWETHTVDIYQLVIDYIKKYQPLRVQPQRGLRLIEE